MPPRLPASQWGLYPSTGSYGRWVVYMAKNDSLYFWRKSEALRFIENAKREEAAQCAS